MPRPRFDHIDPEKKSRLLDAATKEFAEHGYELASINTILENAGLSKGSFYYYFDDKADLAATLMAQAASETADSMRRLKLPTSPDEFWAELRRMSYEWIKEHQSGSARYEMFMKVGGAVVKDSALAARVMPLFQESRLAMAGFLERGQAVGALRSDLPLGMQSALIEALKLAAYKSLYLGDKVPTEAELASFTDLVIDLAKRVTEPKR